MLMTAGRKRRGALLLGSLLGAIALTGSALADTTITLTAGPVTVPGVPVEVCVNQTDTPEPTNECVTTPEALTVALTVVAHVDTPEPEVVPPTITPIECPAGTDGVALRVDTGTAETAIGGSVTITLVVDGEVVSETIPIDEVIAGPQQTVTVFACAGVAPGVDGAI
jgi:hypothetical protein